MKRPTPEDFGMSSDEYRDTVAAIAQQTQMERERRRKVCDRWIGVLLLLALPMSIGVAVVLSSEGHGELGTLAFLAILLGTAYIAAALPQFYTSQESSSIARMRRRIRRYEEAVERYELRQEQYWVNLRGQAFEKRLAGLYRHLGYAVTETKGSYDGGVDLDLYKDGKRLIVQCKGHEKPIGVAAARDLYGTFMHSGADSAILACPAGFTNGVRTFVEGKPIELISAKELIALADAADPMGA